MDMVSLQVANEEDESSSSDENDFPSEAFDIRLTANHSYLQATELGELSEPSIFFDAGAKITVPLLVMNAVLLPGQTLPLHFSHPIVTDFMRLEARNYKYFCLSTYLRDEGGHDYIDILMTTKSSRIATLFQIQNISPDHSVITVQAIGRQRCKVLSPLQTSNIFFHNSSVILYEKIDVIVLDEIRLPCFTNTLDSLSLNRLPLKDKQKCYYHLTAHNSFAITQSLTKSIIVLLKNWLQKWFDLSRISVILNQGSTVFSYWVASNLPVDLETKLTFLEECCTDRRLKMEWEIASQMNSLVCAECGDVKCEVNDMINLSVEGNGMHFVNSNGFVHEMFTVARINNFLAYDKPTLEFSWFPGYAWMIVNCSYCSSHLGWRFTSSKLLPKKFYGLTRKSLKLVATDENPDLSV